MAGKAAPTKRAPRKTTEDRLLDAALTLAAEQPWSKVGMDDIARAAKISLKDAYDAFPERAHMVAAIIARNDRAMLAGDDPSLEGESHRDRLFDAMMRRLEAMRPHKAALRSMALAAPCDPLTLLIAGPRLMRACKWMMRAAGISPDGLVGIARVHAVALAYGVAVREWLKDDSEDLSNTMAALDKALKRAGSLL